MIWATISFQSWFCWLYRASPSLAAKNIISLISVLTIWWCPCVVVFCVVGGGCLLWPVCSLGRTLFMKCSLGISNFLEEISSLSHSVVFLYFFTLIAEEGFLISPCCSLELCIQWIYLSLSTLSFASLLYQLLVRPPQTTILPFAFFFLGDGLDNCFLTMSGTSVHSSSGTLSIRSNPLNRFVTSSV